MWSWKFGCVGLYALSPIRVIKAVNFQNTPSYEKSYTPKFPLGVEYNSKTIYTLTAYKALKNFFLIYCEVDNPTTAVWGSTRLNASTNRLP